MSAPFALCLPCPEGHPVLSPCHPPCLRPGSSLVLSFPDHIGRSLPRPAHRACRHFCCLSGISMCWTPCLIPLRLCPCFLVSEGTSHHPKHRPPMHRVGGTCLLQATLGPGRLTNLLGPSVRTVGPCPQAFQRLFPNSSFGTKRKFSETVPGVPGSLAWAAGLPAPITFTTGKHDRGVSAESWLFSVGICNVYLGHCVSSVAKGQRWLQASCP